MKHRIITISRQFGSGGRTIGKEVAAKLGIPCYNHELIDRIAEQSGFAKEYTAERGEEAEGGMWLAHAFSDRSMNGLSIQDYLWTVQRKVVRSLADKGDCVIVGRGADVILSDLADCLKVFVYADMQSRADRIVRLYGEQTDTPEKRLRDKDKRRSTFYRFYTDIEWGDPKNYHLMLNSGALGLATCVDLIAAAYRNRPAQEKDRI